MPIFSALGIGAAAASLSGHSNDRDGGASDALHAISGAVRHHSCLVIQGILAGLCLCMGNCSSSKVAVRLCLYIASATDRGGSICSGQKSMFGHALTSHVKATEEHHGHIVPHSEWLW